MAQYLKNAVYQMFLTFGIAMKIWTYYLVNVKIEKRGSERGKIMPSYSTYTHEELDRLYTECKEQYAHFQSMGLSLDMSRGKPGADQLALSAGLVNVLSPDDFIAANGTDCRNYGGIDGIPEMKQLFSEILQVRSDEILVGGNSSLSLMYECASYFAKFSAAAKTGGTKKFLCPSPGYDRHFAICEYLGIEMITIPMTSEGPDMDEVRKHITDPTVIGIWCVPVFSNPQGYVYSDEIIQAIAKLSPASPDFRIYWDNAYAIHPFEGEVPQIANLLRECESAGTQDNVLIFTSFSKITFPGAAVAAVAASPINLDLLRKHLIIQTIGPDKINQLRHVRFFGDLAGVHGHMKKHADILRPKFEIVLSQLEKNLAGKGIAQWSIPKGGYFVSFDTLPNCAKRTIAICAEAGLVMTNAGATFPYGKDPQDKNIRIAPSFPPVEQLEIAMQLFCLAVEMAAIEVILWK